MSERLVDRAFRFAVAAHEGQYRKGKWEIPYVTHVVDVMKRTSKFTMDDDILAAALLHDYIEDCAPFLSIEDRYKSVKDNFNTKVADTVMECTRVDGDDIPQEQKVKFLETFKDKSFDSVLIKVADRYSNCLDYCSEGRYKKVISYYDEASPLLNRFRADASKEQLYWETMMFAELMESLDFVDCEDYEISCKCTTCGIRTPRFCKDLYCHHFLCSKCDCYEQVPF